MRSGSNPQVSSGIVNKRQNTNLQDSLYFGPFLTAWNLSRIWQNVIYLAVTFYTLPQKRCAQVFLFNEYNAVKTANKFFFKCVTGKSKSIPLFASDIKIYPNRYSKTTWADLIIVEDELSAVWEFNSKTLMHGALHTVCSWLKIKGV